MEKVQMEKAHICKLCCEIFNENVRPRCLNCGHSFCTNCLNHLIEDGNLTCPKCKQKHRAVNGTDFPINYDLEESLLNCKMSLSAVFQDDLGGGSDKMKTLMEEQKSGTKSLILLSEDLQRQVAEYGAILLDRKSKHEEVFGKFNELGDRNQAIMTEIDGEYEGLTKLLKNVTTLQEIVKSKLCSLDRATCTKSAVAAVADLDESFAALEKWNKHCLKEFPKVKIFMSSEKVLTEITSVLSKANFAKDEVTDVPVYQEANFSIIQMINKITGKSTLSLGELKNPSEALKTLLKEGKVYAIQSDNGSDRSARLSLEGGKMFLHFLQDGKSPAHGHTIKQSSLMESLNTDSTMAFMDLTWDGTLQGRVQILLSPDTPLARQFRILCTGDIGKTYARSKFHCLSAKNHSNESIQAGDYESRNGSGGASVMKGLDTVVGSYTQSRAEGQVYAHNGAAMGPHHAQFSIMTGNGNDGNNNSNVFGKVQSGMSILKAATITTIKNVEITDCGVVVPFDVY